MSQDNISTDVEERHRRFIEQAVASGKVWGLTSEDGWANSLSNDYEDVGVFPFWSDEMYAQACTTEDWEAYEPESIPLGEFMEIWCIGMYQDNMLAGTNWDADLSGKEIEPFELVLELIQELKSKGKSIVLERFDSLEGFEAKIKEAIAEE